MVRLLVVSTILLISCFANAQANNCPVTHGKIYGGDDKPWPWGTELNLPWEEMNGVWQAMPDCDSYFLIKVQKDPSGTKKDRFFINLMQVERGTCRILATGKGFGNQGELFVAAAMVGDNNFGYNVTIRLVRIEQTSKKGGVELGFRSPGRPTANAQFKLTMFPKGDWQRGKSYVLRKQGADTTCSNIIRGLM